MDRNKGVNSEGKFVKVAVTSGLPQAHIIKGSLESAGIPVIFSYESMGPIGGIIIDGLGEVRIMVPSEFAQEALEIVSSKFIPDESPTE